MTALKCLATATILALSAYAATACPGYGEYTLAAAQEEPTTAQSQAAQPAPVQQSVAPTPTVPTDVASAPTQPDGVQR
jgi:hypothetical protein